jgi:hypothetical protein
MQIKQKLLKIIGLISCNIITFLIIVSLVIGYAFWRIISGFF